MEIWGDLWMIEMVSWLVWEGKLSDLDYDREHLKAVGIYYNLPFLYD